MTTEGQMPVGVPVTGTPQSQSIDDIISVRNLIDADLGPLRRFKGLFVSMPYTTEKYQGRDKETTRITLNFKDIEVIEAVEPYQLPTYSLPPISLSNRKKSRWGVLGVSLSEILDMQYTVEQLDFSSQQFIPPNLRMNIKDCMGKVMGMVIADGLMGRPPTVDLFDGRSQTDVPTSCWQVYEVEGIGTAGAKQESPVDRATSLLDGKTITDFNSKALADPLIRTDAALIQGIGQPIASVTNFATALLTAGLFTIDEQGVYHKVATPA